MKTKQNKSISTGISVTSAFLALALLAPPAAFAEEEEIPTETHDGLVLLPDRQVAAAYVDPQADFSQYNKIMILDCYVAFQKNWQKKSKRTGSRISVSSGDMERMKADVAALFRDVFTETLAEDDGYEIVTEAGDDVLLVRPAIIDLDVTAPDTGNAGRSRSYTASSGAATLYIELFDSKTGDILARAADRRVADSFGGHLTYTNRVTNRADARRAMKAWAGLLRDRLDEFHGK